MEKNMEHDMEAVGNVRVRFYSKAKNSLGLGKSVTGRQSGNGNGRYRIVLDRAYRGFLKLGAFWGSP